MTLENLVEVLANVDPVGLIRSGAPRDEYETEAKCILMLIDELKPEGVNEIKMVIDEVFKEWFQPLDHPVNEFDVAKIAKAIVEDKDERT